MSLIAATPGSIWGQTTVYVDADASGSNDGTSWQNAFARLQDGISHAPAGTQIWVADGTYYPSTPGGDRSASFILRPGVEIYGGFTGIESSISARPSPLAVTVLSGDLSANDSNDINVNELTRADNSFHVVTCSNVDSEVPTILDGLTITSGNASGTSIDGTTVGGGLYCVDRTLHVVNSTFERNSAEFGGGLALSGGAGLLRGVRFISNYAKMEGGAFFNQSTVEADGLEILSNVSSAFAGGIMVRFGFLKAGLAVVWDNSAVNGGGLNVLGGELWLVDSRIVANRVIGFGGGVYADDSRVLIGNCVVSGNDAAQNGAGLWTIDGEMRVVNSTIFSNRAGDSGGGSFHWNSSQLYQNVIFSANKAPIGSHVWGTTNPDVGPRSVSRPA